MPLVCNFELQKEKCSKFLTQIEVEKRSFWPFLGWHFYGLCQTICVWRTYVSIDDHSHNLIGYGNHKLTWPSKRHCPFSFNYSHLMWWYYKCNYHKTSNLLFTSDGDGIHCSNLHHFPYIGRGAKWKYSSPSIANPKVIRTLFKNILAFSNLGLGLGFKMTSN